MRLLLAVIFLTIQTPTRCTGDELECMEKSGGSQKTHLSIKSKRNEGGEWDTTFSALKNASQMSEAMDLDLTQAVVDCSEHRLISIQGVIKGSIFSSSLGQPGKPPLLFHKKCSPNGLISNDGRSLQKTQQDGQATAVTNRPLMDGEMFSVRLDKRNSASHPVGIGVTIHPPGTIDIPNHMSHLRSGTWLFYLTNIYSNNTLLADNYTKTNLKDLEAGGIVGVQRDKNGALHLLINGVDQGPSIFVPEVIYGTFELHTGGLKGTIID